VVEYSPHYPKVKDSRTYTTNMEKNCGHRASSSSTEVEHLPHYPKVKGLSLTTTATGTGRENGKVYGHVGSSGSTVVEYSPHYPKVMGSRIDIAAIGNVREKIMKNCDINIKCSEAIFLVMCDPYINEL
jgi:hypothetical protein